MQNEPGESVTASDVAALAGVSRWTVNRAFKSNSSISENSRSKVMQAAEELGYAPDLLAARLASDQRFLVSLLVDDFSNPHKLVMMECITRILRQHGWGSLLVNTLEESDTTDALINASQLRVDAAVLIGSKFSDRALSNTADVRRIKRLIVFARMSANANTISICCDDIIAMEEVTRHVVQQGYKRPLFFAGPQDTPSHLLRQDTFLSNWSASKQSSAEVTSVDVYDPQIAYNHVADYLSNCTKKPDIIVCENDALAIGAIDAIKHELGARIPEDIAVTGFDDVPQAANPNYNLTTYRQPIAQMADGLVQVLMNKPVQHLNKYTGQLIVRSSS